MHHLKSLRSMFVRSATIVATLSCVILAGCADEHTTAPELPRLALDRTVPFNKFFVAWSPNFRSGPIQTQIFGLDPRQNRQFGGLWALDDVLEFARANPGRLYINGDEPDQYCIDPHEYAGIYRNFVTRIRGADATARVSPAGFAEPNDRCCTPGDQECRQRRHSIGYAEQFYNAYVLRYGVAPPVDEWRFHNFGLSYATGDLDGWWARVDREAAWSIAHGAPMVLAAWGFHGWQEPVPAYQEHMKQAMNRIMNDTRINEAVYWAYEMWAGEAHFLAYDDGSLTPQGQTYANPLTDIPASVTAAASPNGSANLQWINTTSAWAAEAEYWVKPPGTGSFVYKSTARLSSPGLTQTPLGAFNAGDSVRGRVRYYNALGQASWSPFSNAVLMPPGDQGANKGSGSTKGGPRFCFLPTGLQSQSCG